MNLGFFEHHKSWLVSAGIAVAIALWLASGQIGGHDVDVKGRDSSETVPQALERPARVIELKEIEQLTCLVKGDQRLIV